MVVSESSSTTVLLARIVRLSLLPPSAIADLGSTVTGSRLSRHDVVITSYETAASDWCDPKPRAKKGAAKGKGKPLLPGMNKLEGAPESEDDTAGGEEELKESGALFSAELYRGEHPFRRR